MKHLMPFVVAAPAFLRGALARRAPPTPSNEQGRRRIVGLIFNICYLAAVGIITLMLWLD